MGVGMRARTSNKGEGSCRRRGISLAKESEEVMSEKMTYDDGRMMMMRDERENMREK